MNLIICLLGIYVILSFTIICYGYLEYNRLKSRIAYLDETVDRIIRNFTL